MAGSLSPIFDRQPDQASHPLNADLFLYPGAGMRNGLVGHADPGGDLGIAPACSRQ
jgi:hypothetical protein